MRDDTSERSICSTSKNLPDESGPVLEAARKLLGAPLSSVEARLHCRQLESCEAECLDGGEMLQLDMAVAASHSPPSLADPDRAAAEMPTRAASAAARALMHQVCALAICAVPGLPPAPGAHKGCDIAGSAGTQRPATPLVTDFEAGEPAAKEGAPTSGPVKTEAEGSGGAPSGAAAAKTGRGGKLAGEPVELQAVAMALSALGAWLAGRRWLARVSAERERALFEAVTEVGGKALEACTILGRQLLKANFAVYRTLEVLRRQQTNAKQTLVAARASAAAADSAAHAGPSSAAARALATYAVCDCGMTLIAAAIAESNERKAELAALFARCVELGVEGAVGGAKRLAEQIALVKRRLDAMAAHRQRLTVGGGKAAVPASTMAALVLQERKQLHLLTTGASMARELRLDALRLDLLPALLQAGSLPAARKDPGVEQTFSDGSVVTRAVALFDELLDRCNDADEAQTKLAAELNIAETKKESAAANKAAKAAASRKNAAAAAAATAAAAAAAAAPLSGAGGMDPVVKAEKPVKDPNAPKPKRQRAAKVKEPKPELSSEQLAAQVARQAQQQAQLQAAQLQQQQHHQHHQHHQHQHQLLLQQQMAHLQHMQHHHQQQGHQHPLQHAPPQFVQPPGSGEPEWHQTIAGLAQPLDMAGMAPRPGLTPQLHPQYQQPGATQVYVNAQVPLARHIAARTAHCSSPCASFRKRTVYLSQGQQVQMQMQPMALVMHQGQQMLVPTSQLQLPPGVPYGLAPVDAASGAVHATSGLPGMLINGPSARGG